MLNKQFEAFGKNVLPPFLEVAKLHSDIFINTAENIIYQKQKRPASVVPQHSHIPSLYSLRHYN